MFIIWQCGIANISYYVDGQTTLSYLNQNVPHKRTLKHFFFDNWIIVVELLISSLINCHETPKILYK